MLAAATVRRYLTAQQYNRRSRFRRNRFGRIGSRSNSDLGSTAHVGNHYLSVQLKAATSLRSSYHRPFVLSYSSQQVIPTMLLELVWHSVLHGECPHLAHICSFCTWTVRLAVLASITAVARGHYYRTISACEECRCASHKKKTRQMRGKTTETTLIGMTCPALQLRLE